MATDARPRLITAASRTKAKRDKANALAESARKEHRRAIVAALDGGVGQSELARALQTSASRIREDYMRGVVEQNGSPQSRVSSGKG